MGGTISPSSEFLVARNVLARRASSFTPKLILSVDFSNSTSMRCTAGIFVDYVVALLATTRIESKIVIKEYFPVGVRTINLVTIGCMATNGDILLQRANGEVVATEYNKVVAKCRHLCCRLKEFFIILFI